MSVQDYWNYWRFLVRTCSTGPFLSLASSPSLSDKKKKNPQPRKLYFSHHQKAVWESESVITILLEGMKMALEFLLGLYPFLFVVIATRKVIRNYQVKKPFSNKPKTETQHIFDIFLRNYTERFTIFSSFKEVISVWVIPR